MKKETVIIIGSSGHAKVVIDTIEQEGKYNIIGLLDDFRDIGSKTSDYKVLGKVEHVKILWEEYNTHFFIAVGDNYSRLLVHQKIVSILPNAKFINAVHPSAQIGKKVLLGTGVVVMPGAIINAHTVIGDFTIINTKASIDHDCTMQDFSSLGPNATLAGNISIGKCSVVGISATVREKTNIGDFSVIGAGALLLKSCGSNVLMYGIPAKKVHNREKNSKYLL